VRSARFGQAVCRFIDAPNCWHCPFVIVRRMPSVPPELSKGKKKIGSTHALGMYTALTHTPGRWIHTTARSAQRHLPDMQTNSQYTSPPCRRTDLWPFDRPGSLARTDIARCNTASCWGHTLHYYGICKCWGRSTSSWILCLGRSLLRSLRCHFHTFGARLSVDLGPGS